MKSNVRRQVFSLILSLCMALALLPAAPVQAMDDPSDLGSITSVYGDREFFANYEPAIQAVALGMEQKLPSIDLTEFPIMSDSSESISSIGSAIYLTALYQHPEFFWVDDTVGISYYHSNSEPTYKLSSLTPHYFQYEDDDFDPMKTMFQAEAERYLDMVRNNPTVYNDDFSRALLLHDELVLDVAYMIDPYGQNSNYRFLAEKLGICENYSRIYAYLLSQLGISCEMVFSDDMEHEWIKLCLDGTYYHVDLTWDDPEPDMPGRVPHTCFLLSDDRIQSEDMGDKRHYNYGSLYPSDDTKFDNAAFHAYRYKLCKLTEEPILYAIGAQGLVSYQYQNDLETELLTIEKNWPVVNKPGYNWSGVYSGLDSYDGWLYYNLPQTIYKYNVSTRVSIPVCSYDAFPSLPQNQYFYGLRIRGNTLYAIVSSSPNDEGNEYYLMELQPMPAAQVFGHSLTLDGRIGVNTYLLFGDEIRYDSQSYQVEFYDGETLVSATQVSDVESTQREQDGNTYTLYPFSISAASNEMDTVFTMRIRNLHDDSFLSFADSDGSATEAVDYAIQDYLREAEENGSETLKPLAQDMQAYGAFSKHYFRVLNEASTEDLPEIAGFEPVGAEELDDYAYTAPEDISGFHYVGTSLLLENETSLRMYFESDAVDSLTISVGGEPLTISEGQRMYYVQVSNIGAPQLDTIYNFSISNSSESASANLGPLGYAHRALSQDGVEDSLRYLMMALYHYNQSANVYFGA